MTSRRNNLPAQRLPDNVIVINDPLVCMLAAARGTVLDLEVEGDDEQAALTALVELIENRFEEDE